MSLEVFLLIDNQLWGEKNGREGCEVVGRKWELIFPSYLESAGAWLLLLGCRVLVVCGHCEWISKDEAEKETKETSKPELNSVRKRLKQTNKQQHAVTSYQYPSVPVCPRWPDGLIIYEMLRGVQSWPAGWPVTGPGC